MTYREIEVPIEELENPRLIARKVFTKSKNKSGYPRWSVSVAKAMMFGGKGDDVNCWVAYRDNKKSWWQNDNVNIPLDLLPLILEVFSTPLKKEQ